VKKKCITVSQIYQVTQLFSTLMTINKHTITWLFLVPTRITLLTLPSPSCKRIFHTKVSTNTNSTE